MLHPRKGQVAPKPTPSPPHRAWRALTAIAHWIADLDGRLVDAASWRRRHLLICCFATANGLTALGAGLLSRHGPGLWIDLAALGIGLAGAWLPSAGRRPRELSAGLSLFVCAVAEARYVGNTAALATAFLLLLSLYQDWLPLALAALLGAAFPTAAVLSPELLAHMRAFQAEGPMTGAVMRLVGMYAALGATLLSWRVNGVAGRDPVTGLASRALIEQRLEATLSAGGTATVLMGDIDAFCLVADNLPGDEVDQLVRDIGRRVRRRFGVDVLIAGMGGARFLVARPGPCSEAEARSVSWSVCDLISREPFTVGAQQIPLTISVGVAFGAAGEAASEVIRAAGQAMRQAKARGKNAVALTGRPQNPRMAPERLVVAELRDALERDEFVVHYQPLVDLASGELVGAEALLRWMHPTRGLLGPSSFLSVCDTHPWLGAQIARRTMQTVLAQVARWDEEMLGCLPEGVAVNVAPTRLVDPLMIEELRALLNDTAVGPERLILELTEGALMDLDVDASVVLSGIAELGVRVALDDFGTGHSSLAHLRDLPVHEIKIDRSFLSRINVSEGDRAVVRAVLAIATQFGATVVVEGVESERQRQAVLAMGGGDLLGQGFLFARPMPAGDMGRLIRGGVALARGEAHRASPDPLPT